MCQSEESDASTRTLKRVGHFGTCSDRLKGQEVRVPRCPVETGRAWDTHGCPVNGDGGIRILIPMKAANAMAAAKRRV